MKWNLIYKSFVVSGLMAAFIMGGDKVSNSKAVNKAVPLASEDVKADEKKDETAGMLSLTQNEKIEDAELVNKAVDALKNYVDLSVNPSKYEIEVTYFPGYKDLKPGYDVYFMVKENNKILAKKGSIGDDGLPTPEVEKLLKPEYFLSFSETKELTDLYTSYVKWEKLKTPLSMEKTKKLAKDFLISKKLADSDKIEFMGAANMSEDRIVVTYDIGNDSVIQVHVNTSAGKVDSFGRMSKKQAEIILSPKEEGYGVG